MTTDPDAQLVHRVWRQWPQNVTHQSMHCTALLIQLKMTRNLVKQSNTVHSDVDIPDDCTRWFRLSLVRKKSEKKLSYLTQTKPQATSALPTKNKTPSSLPDIHGSIHVDRTQEHMHGLAPALTCTSRSINSASAS